MEEFVVKKTEGQLPTEPAEGSYSIEPSLFPDTRRLQPRYRITG